MRLLSCWPAACAACSWHCCCSMSVAYIPLITLVAVSVPVAKSVRLALVDPGGPCGLEFEPRWLSVGLDPVA